MASEARQRVIVGAAKQLLPLYFGESRVTTKGMAATVEEGTAPKLVQVIAGKPFQIASNTGDSRRDGTNFDDGPMDAPCVMMDLAKLTREGAGKSRLILSKKTL